MPAHHPQAPPALIKSIILLRLMRKPAEAMASSRMLASTLLSSSTRGARTCSGEGGAQVVAGGQGLDGVEEGAECSSS